MSTATLHLAGGTVSAGARETLVTTHCVIGAGFQGLPLVKTLLELGERVLCLDRHRDVGGIWQSGAYDTAHVISSRHTTSFPDFPMPHSYPDFPSRDEMQRYLRSYAEAFELLPRIRLGTDVRRVRRGDDAASAATNARRWRVECADGTHVLADTVIIANGHHNEPEIAAYPGRWCGETMHSNEYRTPAVFRGKRVLVIGSGNTACDIAVDASLHGAAADISVRRGTYFFPRTFMGRPLDQLLRGVPLGGEWIERLAGWLVHKATVGDAAQYGLPRPTGPLFERHPVINSELLRRIRLGKVGVRPEISNHEQRTVRFVDGHAADYDLIVWAIGYRVTLPMLAAEDELLDWEEGLPVLFLQCALPRGRGLYVAGLGQARTGGGPLFQLAAELIARMASLDARDPRGAKALIEDDRRLAFAGRWLGFRAIARADMRSRRGAEKERAGAQLGRLLDRVGAPPIRARTGCSSAPSDLQLGRLAPAAEATRQDGARVRERTRQENEDEGAADRRDVGA